MTPTVREKGGAAHAWAPLHRKTGAPRVGGVSAQSEIAVRATDLSLRYHSSSQVTRTVAVDGVDLEIAAGEILAVVGETGSGKSTLARAVALQSDIPGDRRAPRISGGSLVVLGQEVRGISRHRRDRLGARVGYLRQEAGQHLSARLTVEENILEPIYLIDRRFPRMLAGEHAATLLDAVHLPLSMLDLMPHELSKGQRQRVAIARALVLEPAVLIADDPTAGVDVTVRSHILDVIAQLQERHAFAALIVTVDLAEVRRITDRVAVMQQGRIVGIGSMDEVFEDPSHPYVRRLGESLGALRSAS